MKIAGRLVHFIWWGFFTADECDDCGHGKFNWRALWRPHWGHYTPESKPELLLFRYVRWGPVEIRVWKGRV